MKITGEKRKRLIAELVLVLVILAVALPFIIFPPERDAGAYVRVEIGKKLVAEYPLSQNAEYSLNGGTNILVIENGAAYISDANCPKRECITRFGRISRAGEFISCLPNEIFIEIVGEGAEVDFVS